MLLNFYVNIINYQNIYIYNNKFLNVLFSDKITAD